MTLKQLNLVPDVATEKPNYDDIFADDVLKQMKILRIFMKLWKTKKNYMKQGWQPNNIAACDLTILL